MAQLPSNDTYRQVIEHLMINTGLDRWWEEMVDGGGAGREEPKSHAVREVLAKFFVPETSSPILVVGEDLGGGWEEKAAVGMACSLPRTVLRIAQTAANGLARCIRAS